MVKYETIALQGLGVGVSPLPDAKWALVRMGHKLDRMIADQREDAIAMAKRFTDYANKLGESWNVAAPPTAYSTLRDIERRSAEFAGLLDAFKDIFEAVTGKRFHDVFHDVARQVEESDRRGKEPS